jgi:hypothetical protein
MNLLQAGCWYFPRFGGDLPQDGLFPVLDEAEPFAENPPIIGEKRIT